MHCIKHNSVIIFLTSLTFLRKLPCLDDQLKNDDDKLNLMSLLALICAFFELSIPKNIFLGIFLISFLLTQNKDACFLIYSSKLVCLSLSHFITWKGLNILKKIILNYVTLILLLTRDKSSTNRKFSIFFPGPS